MKLSLSGEWVDVKSVKRWSGDGWEDVYPSNTPDINLGKSIDSLLMYRNYYFGVADTFTEATSPFTITDNYHLPHDGSTWSRNKSLCPLRKFDLNLGIAGANYFRCYINSVSSSASDLWNRSELSYALLSAGPDRFSTQYIPKQMIYQTGILEVRLKTSIPEYDNSNANFSIIVSTSASQNSANMDGNTSITIRDITFLKK